MDRNDRQAIEDLFDRLQTVETQSAPRDRDAESFIGEMIARQPAAPYFMAQTVIMQRQALEAAERRIAELEAEASQPQGGGLLDSFFGAGRRRSGSVPSVGRSAARPPETAGPFGRGAPAGQIPGGYGAGGGFLAGAAQTAMGVAGGVLLGNMIAGAFGGGEAHAADAADSADAQSDPGADEAGDGGFDAGGDFDAGDF